MILSERVWGCNTDARALGTQAFHVQVDEVASFVANTARRVLGVDAARVLPVSARAALDAKLAATKDNRGFFGTILALPS